MDERLKICMISPELSPFAKVGGLGDCVASLSKFIAQLGHEVKVVLPKYASISLPQNVIEYSQPLIINMGYGTEYGKIWESKEENLSIYFIEFDRYFNRDGVYSDTHGDYGDNYERFAFLSRVAIDLCYYLNWIPDVFHGHDWTTGLIPVMLDTIEQNRPMGQCGSVFTIHNLQHHGYAPRSILDFLGIPNHVFRADGVEAFGQVNMMKAGLYFASKLTTVSETYSREIQTPEFGFGLDPVLKFRAGDLIGIRNGIDENLWSPQTDPLLPAKYSAKNMRGKAVCKKKLQEYCNFAVDRNVPILGVVSRLYEQKGLDTFANILPSLFKNLAIQVVFLGNGENILESRFIGIAKKYYERCFVHIGFQEALSHLIEAGADFFVMPSRFEPCGLNQMYSMRYGTLPIARATGGLRDTIENFSKEDGIGTGFLFQKLTDTALYDTIQCACDLYRDAPDVITAMRKRAMQQDFSWNTSAKKYIDVYRWAKKH
ncbi:MAG: glycogen synthase GlgA [Puniceicoccales bacterium]|jgi:starch synthase|nr:glycogen synthase GlgA [Puniceicoccales bacterium]